MITIILTYRNRDPNILHKCLKSLANQTSNAFKVVLVNYGSDERYTNDLNNIKENFPFLSVIHCQTSKQLWCKSRAINIVLKQCDTSHFFVGDVDMIYHPECMASLEALKDNDVTYFKVGFLSEEESLLDKAFDDYDINFHSNEEATGITLYKTEVLKSVNGYDEFYHGWGSEDTDVHVRLKNTGHNIRYYDENILMLHQWHEKGYRTKDSLEPFHSSLEQINAAYLQFAENTKKTKANINYNWGHYSEVDQNMLETQDSEYNITNAYAEVKAFIPAVLFTEKNKVVKVAINEHAEYKSLKQFVKGKIGKKTITYLSMEEVNDLILETLITRLRGCAYHYEYNRKANQINLTIKL